MIKTAFLFLAVLSCGGLAGAAPPKEAVTRSAKGHFLRGLLLERRGEPSAALAEYERAFVLDGQAASICRQAAELALEADNTAAARIWVERLQALEPSAAQTNILTGRAHWALGDTEKASAAFEAALKLDPHSAESVFSLGNLLGARFPDKARSLFLRFINDDPEHAAEAHYQLALLEHKAGRIPTAITHLKRSIELDGASTQVRYALAHIYEMKRDTEAALIQYDEILRQEPQNAALLNHVGELYYLARDFDQAKMKFSAVLAVVPSDPVASQWLAMIAETSGDPAQAADYLKVSAALAEDAGLNLRLSYYLSQAGRTESAVAALEKANVRWPANDEIAYFLALGYDDLKRPQKAVALLRGLLKLKPDYRDARYQLAVLLEKMGRIPEAEVEFRLLLSKKPDDAVILNYLGYSLADRGIKLSEAQGLIERAVRLDPSNGAYQDSLGWVYHQQGRSTEAVVELLAAAAKLPEDVTVWDHLGDAYHASGQAQEAWRAWKRAQAGGSAEAKISKKTARLEKQFDPSDLGSYYLGHFRQIHGGAQKFSGLCEVKGLILGRSFSFSGVLTYRDPSSLELDLLGPLFTPLLRMRLKGEEFSMDPIPIEGIDPAVVSEAVYGSLALVRDYLSGRVFGEGIALYRSNWRKSEVEVPGWRLGLASDRLRLESLSAEGAASLRLDMGEFTVRKGRHLPQQLTVTGKGFALGLRIQKLNVEFK